MTSLERFVEIDATPVTDADGIIGSGQFLDYGTTNRVADFSNKDFRDGLVFAVNFKGHSWLDPVFSTDGENGDAEFTLQADDAGVLQVTHPLGGQLPDTGRLRSLRSAARKCPAPHPQGAVV